MKLLASIMNYLSTKLELWHIFHIFSLGQWSQKHLGITKGKDKDVVAKPGLDL